MNNFPLIAIIVPTCDRPQDLQRCLEALRLNNALIYVTVTDDSEGYETKYLIEDSYPEVRYFRGKRAGPAANRNNGAQCTTSEWILFVDDDCIPDSQWLDAYLQAFRLWPACNVFEGRTYADRPKQRMDEEAPLNETGGYLWSCNFAIRRTLFEGLGGFDERFPYAAMEDVDLRYRLRECLGESIQFVPNAAVCHPWRQITGDLIYRKRQTSIIIYLEIHPSEYQRFTIRQAVHVLARRILKVSIPEFIRYRGRGWVQEARYIYHLSVGRYQLALSKWKSRRPQK